MSKILKSFFSGLISFCVLTPAVYGVSPRPPGVDMQSQPIELPSQHKSESNSSNYIISNHNFENSLPKYTKEWLEYIKDSNPALKCPQNQLNSECTFTSTVVLDETSNKEYKITIKGHSFIEGLFSLPSLSKNSNSDSRVWFKTVMVNNKPAEIINLDSNFFVSVPNSEWDIQILLSQDTAKELANIVFQNIPLILKNNIKNKQFIKDGNTVRLSQSEELKVTPDVKDLSNKEELQFNVFRKISTGIPNVLNTKIKISYSGKPKDYFLGKIIPDAYEFNTAQSSLRIEKKDDGFWIKLLAGEHELNIESFLLKNTESVNVNGLITDVNNEIWSVEQRNNIRQVEVLSLQSLDPKQALVPEQWRAYPAFMVKDKFSFKTNQRGIEENKNMSVNVSRQSFVGFENDKMIHFDTMSVSNQGLPFLSKTSDSFTLENIKLNKQDQILVNNNNVKGISIPKGNFSIDTQGYTNSTDLNIQFFDGTTTINNWQIAVAPRMRMLAAIGDSITSKNTWLDHWNLYTVFSVFVIVLSFFKLFGKTTAVFAFLGLLIFQTEIFSWALWLSILIILGLLKVLPSSNTSKFSNTVKNIGFFTMLLFLLNTIVFIKNEIQLMFNPSLELLISNNVHFSYYIMLSFKTIGLGIIFYVLSKTFIFNKHEASFSKSKSIVLGIIGAFLFIAGNSLNMGASTLGIEPQGGQISKMHAPSMDESQVSLPASAPASIALEKEFLSESISSRSNVSEPKRKIYSNSDITNNIIMQKVQVGSGLLNWPFNSSKYYIQSSKGITKTADIKFLIAPVWMVNLFSLFQILFLVFVMFIFVIGLLHLSNNKNWFNKIPTKLREHKFVQFLLLNDLKKGV